MLDIATIKAEIKEIFDRKPTRAEITCYLVGYTQGVILKVGVEAPAAAAEESAPPGLMFCPHCGKTTPKDAPRCIHCHKAVKSRAPGPPAGTTERSVVRIRTALLR